MRHTKLLGVGAWCLGIAFAPAAAAQPVPATTPVDAVPPPASPPATPPSTPPPAVVAEPSPPVVTETAPARPPAPAESVAGAATPQTTLQVFADQEHAARTAGSVVGLAVGAGLVAGGLVADLEYDKSYGTTLWAIGIGAMVGSAIGFFVHGPTEALAAAHGSSPPDELQRAWAGEANKAHKERQVAGGITIGLGVIAAGAGAAIAAGVGDLDREAKEDWTTALLVGGGGLVGAGIAALVVETPIEQGYRAAYGRLAPAPFAVGMAPAPGGASFAVSGRF